jgi:S1-C subfamily serine protease
MAQPISSPSGPPFPGLRALSDGLAGLVVATARHVVQVHAGGRSNPSGIVWREGLVVTAEEALANDEGLAVTTSDGTRHPATLAGRDPSTAVALVRVEGLGGPALPQATGPADLRTGALAFAVGRDGANPIAAFGVVAEVGPSWRSSEGGLIDALLRLDMRLPPRSEGGLVVDADGVPVGMAVFGPRRRTLVIPTSTVDRAVSRLLEHGSVSRGYLGLGLQPVALPGARGRGVICLSVEPGGPADRAGLLQGDVIVALDGTPLRDMRDLVSSLGPDRIGQPVTLTVHRAGEARDVTVEVGARPRA